MKGIKSCILISLSFSFFSESKVLIFPVATEINKGLFSSYSLSTVVSKDSINVRFSDLEKKFLTEQVLIENTSNIYEEENSINSYRYVFDVVDSYCYEKDSNEFNNQGFMDVFLNGVKYESGDITIPISLDGTNKNGFLYKNDILELKNDKKIETEIPLTCEGEVIFKVELFL